MKRFKPSFLYIVPSVIIGAISLFLCLALIFKNKTAGLLFLVVVLIPLIFILIFINFRFITIEDEKMCFKTLLTKRCLDFKNIEHVRVQRIGMRNVLWVESKDGSIITPLIFSDIKSLRDTLKEMLGEKVSLDNWRRSTMDLILLYLATVFLIFVVLVKLI